MEKMNEQICFDEPEDGRLSVLNERSKTHGDYKENAKFHVRLMDVVLSSEAYLNTLTDAERVAVDMIIHKLARILASKRRFMDHWRDIAGYATLAMEAIEEMPGTYDVDVTPKKLDSSGEWRTA